MSLWSGKRAHLEKCIKLKVVASQKVPGSGQAYLDFKILPTNLHVVPLSVPFPPDNLPCFGVTITLYLVLGSNPVMVMLWTSAFTF